MFQLIFTSLRHVSTPHTSSSGSAPMCFLLIGSLCYLCLPRCSFFVRLVVTGQMANALKLGAIKIDFFKNLNKMCLFR
jgi:hypothetical protein